MAASSSPITPTTSAGSPRDTPARTPGRPRPGCGAAAGAPGTRPPISVVVAFIPLPQPPGEVVHEDLVADVVEQVQIAGGARRQRGRLDQLDRPVAVLTQDEVELPIR